MKPPWTPWHKVVRLREDLKTGDLALNLFAADLHDAAMGKPPAVYRDPREFFSLTYPTFNLRELAKDVVTRLAGKNEKAVRQLELTYGGGKTHSLITLYHLVNDPARLPDIPAVEEFKQHIGMTPPRARVAVLAFDKLDVEKGTEVRGPSGKTRWLRHPWSVLAFQIAGSEGLELLHADGKDAERESAPAENLLVELLSMPRREGLATLVLIDEVLMFAREKIGLDPAWRGRLKNFFQYLTQAATKVPTCAIVASLLATDPGKSDTLGKEITQELYAVFRREREEGVQPVVKEDVAEVLRRRFFQADSIRDREAFRPHVVAALKGIADIDEQTRKDGKAAEERFLKSYPFHPDLTEILYAKWTNLEGFQRTRGVLRTFALALREAERWDEGPLVGANVFLGEPGKGDVSEAARELTGIATTEEYEGKWQEWNGILVSEFSKAREIQAEAPSFKFREVEQAVFATFLHSQPIGQKASTRDLVLLLGGTRPDRIELEKALRRWAEASWFLDEACLNEAEVGPDGRKALPKSWRLGLKPNLTQMHHDACIRVPPELVESKLQEEISKAKSLTSGASAAGARVHNLPDRPKAIEDDGEFHYAVLGPKAASESGKPSPEASRFLDETTSPDRPRVYRNAVILAVPSRDGLEIVRNRIREALGWDEVQSQLRDQPIDPIRAGTLASNLSAARRRVPEAIQQAYCIVVTVSEKNEPQAFKVSTGDEPLFLTIKKDPRSRIQETAVEAEALLPDGPYDLWKKGETARRLNDLVGAFAQFPHLPKMLNRRAILDTLLLGCRTGRFGLRITRPDRSCRTFWMQEPDGEGSRDPGLEVVLPEAAVLSEVEPALLSPGSLPGLWEKQELSVGAVVAFFSGGRVVKVKREGYEESLSIPRAERPAIEAAIQAAVREGRLWLTSDPASILGEEIPAGVLNDNALLQAPPQPIPVSDVLPADLPEAWAGDTTTALGIAAALSKKAGRNLPWQIVRDAIDGALRARMLERAPDSGPWPCTLAGAAEVKLRRASVSPPPPPLPPPNRPGLLVAEANVSPSEIQDLAERVANLVKAAAGLDLKFRLRVELGGTGPRPSPEAIAKLNDLLKEIAKGLCLR